MRVHLAATHPIQYQVPWFRALAKRPEVDLEVGYVFLPDPRAQGSGFGVAFEWDVPLLGGYAWTELERAGRTADLDRFASLRLRRPRRWLSPKPHALIVTGWHRLPLIQLALAGRRLGIPVLARGDSPGGRRRRLVHRVLLAGWLRRFAAFLVVGEANRNFYRELGVPEARLFECPHFVDNERFASGAEEAGARKEEIRSRWGIAEDEIAVLFCGKLIAEKNLEELLEAMAEAGRLNSNLRLVLVGDGPLRTSIEVRSKQLQVPVAWDGFRNQKELPGIYAAADLLVLPSRSETWGLVVNEAMACGLAVVASDRVGCVPDLVHPGRTGEVYPSGQPRELADRIVRLAADRDLRRAEGEAGRKLVLERYSVDRAVEGTLAALESVVRAA